MLKKFIKIILILFILLFIITLYFYFFQRPFLGKIKDYSISTYVSIQIKNSESYKKLKTSNKTLKYYKNEKDLKIPIILYHEISNYTPERSKNDLYTSDKQFEYQISNLLNLGYTFITYNDLVLYYNNELALPEYVALITFDDGYKGVYENAFPIIQKYNIPINIFVINSCINSGSSIYFSWDEARKMDKSNLVYIYSHGKEHIPYGYESGKKTVADITEAHMNIERELGHSVTKVFAYPFGSYNEDTLSALTDAGFIQNLLLESNNHSSTLCLSQLTRIYVKQNYNVEQILKLIL